MGEHSPLQYDRYGKEIQEWLDTQVAPVRDDGRMPWHGLNSAPCVLVSGARAKSSIAAQGP